MRSSNLSLSSRGAAISNGDVLSMMQPIFKSKKQKCTAGNIDKQKCSKLDVNIGRLFKTRHVNLHKLCT